MLVPLLDRVPLVMKFLSASETYLDLYERTLEVDLRRHDRESLLIDLPLQPFDLLLGGKQYTLSIRLMIMDVPEGVRRYMETLEDELHILADPYIGVAEGELAAAYGFYLGAFQDHTALERVSDLIVVKCLLVLLNDLDAFSHDLIELLCQCPESDIR